MRQLHPLAGFNNARYACYTAPVSYIDLSRDTYFGLPPLEQFIDPDSVIVGVPGAPDMRTPQPPLATTIARAREVYMGHQMQNPVDADLYERNNRLIDEMLRNTRIRQREGN